MKRQEAKIKYRGIEVFFFAHTFKTALEHAYDFVNRNMGKYEMRLYILNESNFGEQWTLIKVYN